MKGVGISKVYTDDEKIIRWSVFLSRRCFGTRPTHPYRCPAQASVVAQISNNYNIVKVQLVVEVLKACR